jgi:hypothetical protein
MALGSIQSLMKMSTRNIPGGKGGRCVRLTNLHAECNEIWEPKPPGTLWASPGLLRDCFTFTLQLTQYFSDVKIEKNEMGGACSAYGGGERLIQRFGGQNLRERNHLGDSSVDGKIILRWIFRKWGVRVWTGWSWLRIGTGGGHL